MENLLFFIFQVLVVLFSIVLHEVSHGLTANSLGDSTAKHLGRLTLNPLKHLDFFGSIVLPLLTFWTTGFVFGYAKPVPYNPLNLRDQRYGAAKVAAAGPLTNITIAVLLGLTLRFLPESGGVFAAAFAKLLSFGVLINVLLAIFNLVPIPPLDGHWLALTFVPSVGYYFRRFGLLLFLFFLFFLFPLLSPVIWAVYRLIVGG